MPDRKLKYLFIVQGEGRGHMTQAIALFEILSGQGHEVAKVFVGKSDRRNIPAYFINSVKSSVEAIPSPNFVTDKKNKSIRVFSSIFYNLLFARRFFRSLRYIEKKRKELQPDVIVNFYDILGGLYMMLYRPAVKYLCVGHHYLAEHPEFRFAAGRPVDKFLFKSLNRLTAFGADKCLALSFAPRTPAKHKKIVVTPPLLRKEIFCLSPAKEPFLLGYMVNDGYAEEIMAWHAENRHVEIHCFWDRKGMPDEYAPHENLVFHQLDSVKFLDRMRRCRGVITTAGFESICEAMYFGKPTLMRPVAQHYEQSCNAIDAVKAKAGMTDDYFNISEFLKFIETYDEAVTGDYRKWLSEAKDIALKEATLF